MIMELFLCSHFPFTPWSFINFPTCHVQFTASTTYQISLANNLIHIFALLYVPLLARQSLYSPSMLPKSKIPIEDS